MPENLTNNNLHLNSLRNNLTGGPTQFKMKKKEYNKNIAVKQTLLATKLLSRKVYPIFIGIWQANNKFYIFQYASICYACSGHIVINLFLLFNLGCKKVLKGLRVLIIH